MSVASSISYRNRGIEGRGGLYRFLRNEALPGMIARRTGRVLLRIVHDLG